MTKEITNDFEHSAIMDIFQEVYDIMATYDDELSKTEKRVLAEAMVLMERKEPKRQILGQLMVRLEHFNRSENDGAIKGGLHPAVQALLVDLHLLDQIKMNAIVPGVESSRVFRWRDAIEGSKMTADEIFVGGGFLKLNSEEKEKTMDDAFMKSKSELVKKNLGKPWEQGCTTVIWIFIAVIVGILLLGYALSKVVNG